MPQGTSMRTAHRQPEAGRDALSEEAADFRQSGYAVLPGFIGPDELPPLRACVDEVASAPPDPIMARPGNHLSPLRWQHPIVSLLLRGPERIRRLKQLLAAPDLKWLSAYVSTKPPLAPPLWWHQDWWCWSHPISFRRAPPQVAVLCYLTDTTRDNGALRVLPGSHAHSLPLHALLPEAHGHAVNSLGAGHPAMRDHAAQMTLPVQASDAIVTDYRLLHGTHANRSAHRRDCVLMSFLPAWGKLPSELLMHLASHPALPAQCEAAARRVCGYDELLPPYSPARASLPIHRMPPVQFTTRD